MSRTSSAVGVVSIALLIWLLRGRTQQAFRKPRQMVSLAWIWLPAFLGLVVIYVILFNAMHFYYRYSAILVVLTIPALAPCLRHPPRCAVCRCCAGRSASILCCVDVRRATHGPPRQQPDDRGGYIHRNFPGVRVGCFQSGVVGFFNNNVENLDGKLIDLPSRRSDTVRCRHSWMRSTSM